MDTPGEVVKSWATREEVDAFVSIIAPIVSKYCEMYNCTMNGAVIAECCLQGGYGFSSDAVYNKNLLYPGTKRQFKSWDQCISTWFKEHVKPNNQAASQALNFNDFWEATHA